MTLQRTQKEFTKKTKTFKGWTVEYKFKGARYAYNFYKYKSEAEFWSQILGEKVVRCKIIIEI